jgi:hypothetical protein
MKRRSSGVAAIALCAALLVPSTGVASARGAGPFLVRMIEEKMAGRYADAWSSLYPFHQRVVSRADYVACERLLPFDGHLESVTVVRVVAGPVAVAGLARPVAGAAVTMRVVVRWPGLAKPVVIVDTMHAVAAHGRWTWILSPDRFALYRGRGCGIHAPA